MQGVRTARQPAEGAMAEGRNCAGRLEATTHVKARPTSLRRNAAPLNCALANQSAKAL